MDDLAAFSERLTQSQGDRARPVGQVFTPTTVARFMAGQFSSIPTNVRLLDPGAGTGILTAAFCDRVSGLNKARQIFVEAWESDKSLIPSLRKTLEACRDRLSERGHELTFRILADDFVLEQAADTQPVDIDCAILNPPYFKLNQKSKHAIAMTPHYTGQPNIYAAFIALCLNRLKVSGELVAITPRSFCNGLYFRGFRRFIREHGALRKFHLFDSRIKTFESESVLQETLITTIGKQASTEIEISSSECGQFRTVNRIVVPLSTVVNPDIPESIIRLPLNDADRTTLAEFDRYDDTFATLGLSISTGPVVDFRCREKLVDAPNGSVVPLLWMHNLKPNSMKWPTEKSGRPQYIVDDAETSWMLLPDENYVILKRFSAKEEKRRIVAGLHLKGMFGFVRIGMENHLNYIYSKPKPLDRQLAKGLATWFNSTIVDAYFRIVNGNTQVNATEIREMPMPPIKFIRGLARVKHFNPDPMLPLAI